MRVNGLRMKVEKISVSTKEREKMCLRKAGQNKNTR